MTAEDVLHIPDLVVSVVIAAKDESEVADMKGEDDDLLLTGVTQWEQNSIVLSFFCFLVVLFHVAQVTVFAVVCLLWIIYGLTPLPPTLPVTDLMND